VKRAARKTVGSSVKKQADGTIGAKVGFGVGKPPKKKRLAMHERSVYGQGGAGLAKGVGLGVANIHWFVLGTRKRYTGDIKGKATGHPRHYTGRIRPELKGLVPTAIVGAKGAMISEAARRSAVALKREAMKAKKGA
jgi:hypothetical protein